MSKQHFNSRAPLTVTFDQFHGITTPSPTCKHPPKRIVNFRIGEDGSLQKRPGTQMLFDFSEKIRSHWSGYLNGTFRLYLLAGNTLYLAYPKSKSYQSIGVVSTTEGSSAFFCLQGTLYMNDGEKLYCIQNDRLTEAIGYVPLYGKDWDNDNMGEIHEPFNILNPHVRITYHVPAPPSIFLRVPKKISSVEAIFRNGVRLGADEFRLNTKYNVIEIPDLAAEDYLEAYLTFEQDISEIRRLFCSMQGSVFFGSPERSRTFFFGADGSDTIFCTENVTPENLDHACRVYDSDPLYLPEGNEFRIGERRYPIHGALRHKNNLLIFTEGETWLGGVDSTGHTALPSVPVNSELGCLSSDGYVLAQNEPITVSRHGLYLWQSEDPDVTQRDAVRISQAIDDILTPEELKSAAIFYDSMRDELWLNLPGRNEIRIYSMKRGEWFCFTGISADRFFDADGQIGFFSGSKVGVFDPTLPCDLALDGTCCQIPAVYESAPLDFDSEQRKNLSELSLCGDFDSALLTVSLRTNDGEQIDRMLDTSHNLGHTFLTLRVRSGRFQTLSLSLATENLSFPTIHSLTLTAH